MSEPTTANIGLIVPNTGDLVGAWGTAAINVNWQAVDGYIGGVLTLSLSVATTITLTTASASLTPGAGPYQSANSIVELSGTLTGNQILQIAQPGIYRVLNGCTVGTSYVQVKPSVGTGLAVGIPDGELWHVHFDGTNCRLLGLPHVGAFLDLCAATSPAWLNAFSVAPYLLCNGATYSTATFPALSARLGSTFGGNGVTTFGVPDFQNRYFIPMDFGGNNRLTNAGSGIDGAVFGAAGGSQALQQHNHTATSSVTDPGHQHIPFNSDANGPALGAGQYVNWLRNGTNDYELGGSNTLPTLGLSGSTTSGISVSTQNATAGSGSSGNIPPGLVGGLRFLKT
jgi:microcystin-dependent protein